MDSGAKPTKKYSVYKKRSKNHTKFTKKLCGVHKKIMYTKNVQKKIQISIDRKILHCIIIKK